MSVEPTAGEQRSDDVTTGDVPVDLEPEELVAAVDLLARASEVDEHELLRAHLAHPVDEHGEAVPDRGIAGITGGRALFPLLVLTGFAIFDAMDRATVQVLLPDLRDAFGLNDTGILAVLGIGLVCALLLTVPISFFADRRNRTRLMLIGASVFAGFSLFTGIIPTVWWFLLIARMGAASGQATIFPTHNSLLADHYDVPFRPKVYSFHRSAEGLGLFIGFIAAGELGEHISWRVPFFVIAVPTLVLVAVGLRLREPKRGHFERAAMGLRGEVVELQEPPPSFEEAYRLVNRVGSLRRIFWALPFLGISLVGFGLLSNLLYQQKFGLAAGERGVLEAVAELFQLVGVVVSAVWGTRLIRRDPSLILRLVTVEAMFAALCTVAFAFGPNVAVITIARIGISASLAAVIPAVFSILSMAIPPRARSAGFSIAVLYVLPGLALLPVVGWISDTWGVSWGLFGMAPVFLVGAFIVASAAPLLDQDIHNVFTATAARAELLDQRAKGSIEQLLVRGLDVSYGDVQVLFGVDLEVRQGEIVALLGTNGAGKSTLLRAITGVVEAHNGAVVFDGRDITHAPPHEVSRFGIAMVPGGQGTFGELTVAENLRVASWNEPRRGHGGRAARRAAIDAKVERVLTTFPVLRQRLADPAADLSGGQQQMLALGMAFLSSPSLLAIDELSLGLAPVVVEQLVEIVRAINESGTTVILVEQSVNVALTLAESAYFMEKGEIRFHGPTSELLDRPDVLRSVFLEGASQGLQVAGQTTSVAVREPGAAAGSGGGAGPIGSTPVAADAATTGQAMLEETGVATGSGPAALEVAGLSVRFGGIRAVDDVTLTLGAGEIVGMIGPNGAGKTTLFDLISGFLRADAGRIRLDGRDVTHRTPDARARLGLGRSFQDARLFPSLTVEDTIAVALERFVDVRDPFNAMLRMPVQQDSEHEVRRRVDELMELMGISEMRSKFVRELSTGSRRVVDLACVLAHQPAVVLLDEPSSGIAQREAEALGPLIRRVRDALGASILVIEHDMPLIASISDRMVALDQGRVIASGPGDGVLHDPAVIEAYLGTREDLIARSGRRMSP
jgi:branched-chain amino acid transport system ATP-binding protein